MLSGPHSTTMAVLSRLSLQSLCAGWVLCTVHGMYIIVKHNWLLQHCQWLHSVGEACSRMSQ